MVIESENALLFSNRWKVILSTLPEKLTGRGVDIGGMHSTSKALAERFSLEFDTININPHEGGPRSIVANLEQPLPLKSETYTVAFAGEVIEHLRNTDDLFKELNRIMKLGGELIITTPNLASIYNRLQLLLGKQPNCCHFSGKVGCGKAFGSYGHCRLFTLAALRQVAEFYGFKFILARGYYGNEPSQKWRFLRAMSMILPTTMKEGLVMKFVKTRNLNQVRN